MKNSPAQQTRLIIYCVAMTAAFVTWVVGSAGLGPLDDHAFIRTIFLGKNFGAYIDPELGRFFPLTAQEYVLASKIFGLSAQIFYLLNAVKLVFCSILLYLCLVRMELDSFVVAAFWTVGIFSMGIANTLFRLSAGELNEYVLMLAYTLCVVHLSAQVPNTPKATRWVTTIACMAFFLALFYKELAFVFGFIFAASEIVRSYWVAQQRPTPLIWVTFALSIIYIVFYGIWRSVYVTGSYATLQALSIVDVLQQFASNDPFVVFVAFPLSLVRFFIILGRRQHYCVYDSFLAAGCAYTGAYVVLAMFNTYYLLPAYAFFLCGVAGIASRCIQQWVLGAISAAVLMLGLNTFPMALSDVQTQKMIADNHFQFVNYLAEWLQSGRQTASAPRNLVLAGVSPGNGFEILFSLKTYLIALGVQASSFEVRASEPSDNLSISNFFQVKATQGYQPEPGDLLIFNPYQQKVTRPPLRSPSYREVYRSASEWALPRWLAWQWLRLCVFQRTQCANSIANSTRYAGYAAMQVERSPTAKVEPVPLTSPAYRLGAIVLPERVARGTTTKLVVSVQNTGTEAWPADGSLHTGMLVNLAYRWFDSSNQLVLEGDRSPLPESMHPSDIAKVALMLKTPTKAGKYRLSIGPVQEGAGWFPSTDDRQIEIY